MKRTTVGRTSHVVFRIPGFRRHGRQFGIPQPAAATVRTIAFLLALENAGGLRAEEPPTHEQRAALERVAVGRARTEILDQIRGLPLDSGSTIGAWSARRLELDRALRLWARTLPRSGAVRLYSDGVCEVDLRLTPETLREKLLSLRDQFPRHEGDPVTTVAIRRAAADWPILHATGWARRGETAAAKPAGWEDVQPEGIEMARRAAAADAQFALLEEAGRLKVTNTRRLGEFLESSEAVRSAVQTAVARAADITVELAPDQVAVAAARLRMTDLLRIVTEACQTAYRGEQFSPADFREMALLVTAPEVTATGLATPPAQTRIRSAYREIELDAPAWVETTMGAVGRYSGIPDGETAPADEADRTEQARADGIDALRKQVEALVIRDGATVEQWLAYHNSLKDDVIVFLSGARVIGWPRTLPDGGLEVRVELPLRRLWEILKRKMERVEVDPPADRETTTQPGTAP
jgi:hypothetical protein